VNIAQKIAKESAVTFTGMFYGNINRYLYTLLLARWVGSEFLGIYSLANSVRLISEVFGKMGMEIGVMRFVSLLNPDIEKKKIQRLIGSAVKMTMAFSVVIMAGLLVSSGFIVTHILKEPPLLKIVLMVFAIAIPFNAITLVVAFATQGFKRLKYKIFITQFLNPTILLVVMIISFWFISVEVALMAPMLVSSIIGFIVMFAVLKKLTGVKNQQLLKAPFDRELLVFSYPLMFVTILLTLMHWMDILMLGAFTNASTVGLYHPAARTAGLLQALLTSFLSIYSPMIAQFHAESDQKNMSGSYKLVSRWLLTFSIPVALIFLVYPQKVMLLFGAEYLPSANVLIVLTAATFIHAILGAAQSTLSMTGHTRLLLWNAIGAFIINIILNIILIPNYGMIGAAWATLISLFVISLLRVLEVRWILKLTFFSTKMIKPILAGSITWWCLWRIHPIVMDYHTLVTLSAVSLISFLVYGIVLWVMRLESEDWDFLTGLGILKNSLKK
jgi:O-antigen/teichoic acid export membrane protein